MPEPKRTRGPDKKPRKKRAKGAGGRPRKHAGGWVALSIPAELRARLRAASEREGVPMYEVIERALGAEGEAR